MNMKKTFSTATLSAGLLLASLGSAPAVPVTFQVNMDYQINIMAAFDPATGTVTCRGSFNGWGSGFVLTNSPANTNLYTGTIDIAGSPGTTYEYKFVFNNNTGGGDQWETVGTPNRYFKLGSAAQVIPEAYYADTWGGGPSVDVSFKVDMSAQIGAGNFNPLTDFVEVRGSFTGWGGGTVLTNDPAQPHIYSGAYTEFTLPPGAIREYKFVYVDSVAVAHWESLPGYFRENRSFLVPTNNLDLPVVYFSDTSGYPIKAAVSFAVDLNAQMLQGSFDPLNDQVWARGNVLGWGDPPQGIQLFEDTTRPGIYTNLYTMNSQLTGSPFEYKYTLYRPATFATVWEGGANKYVTFTGNEPTNAAGYHLISVGPTYFDGLSPNGLLPADTLVTFRVDMNNAQRYGGAAFNPLTEGVWFNGDVLTNGWDTYGTWGTQPPETRMFDDGTHGDAVAGDKIYSWQYLVKKGSRLRVQYKYGIESYDNEAPAFQDHVRYIRSVGTYVMPLDIFGNQYQEPSFGDLTIAPGAPGYVLISWLGRPGVRLQTTPSLVGGNWEDLPATDGLSSTNYPVGATPRFFRLVSPN